MIHVISMIGIICAKKLTEEIVLALQNVYCNLITVVVVK